MATTKQNAARDALRKPDYSTKHVLADVGRFVPALERATREAASTRVALQLAEMESTDPAVRQLYEPIYQRLAAIQRLTGELTDRARDLVSAFRQLDEAVAQLDQGVASQTPAVPTTAVAPKPRAVAPKVVRSRPEK